MAVSYHCLRGVDWLGDIPYIRVSAGEKELVTRLNQALREKETLNSQVKEVQDILEPLRQEVNILRNNLLTPKKKSRRQRKSLLKMPRMLSRRARTFGLRAAVRILNRD